MDYGCGTRLHGSIFHDEEPPATFKKFSEHLTDLGGGHTLRTNVVIEIEVIPGPQPPVKMGRIIRPISESLPRSLAGKPLGLLTGSCLVLPEIGARGVVWGTIHAESSDRPFISLY
jgi:hypothetical protein